jgi:hypothetical protein
MEAEMTLVLVQEEKKLFAEFKMLNWQYGKDSIKTRKARRAWRVVATTLRNLEVGSLK